MTDTTDTAALPKMTLDNLLIRCTDYDDGSLSMDSGELKMLNQHISLLEAERQRADRYRQKWTDTISDNCAAGKRIKDLEEEIAELKAKLANPVVFPERKKASFYSDYQFSNKDLASVYNGAIREIKHKLHAAGFTVKD